MMRKRKTPLLAISIGDPAGIGPEVVLKSIAAFARRGNGPDFVVIGDMGATRDAADKIEGAPMPIEWHRGEALPPNGLPVLALSTLSSDARELGHPSVEGGDAIFFRSEEHTSEPSNIF